MSPLPEHLRNPKGQILVEAVFAIGIASILTAGSLSLLARAYKRARCLNRFFWDAHSYIYRDSFDGSELTRQCGARVERIRFRRLDENGAMTIYFAVWLAFFVLTFVAIIVFMEENRKAIALQLTLDSCVGQHAIEYAKTLNRFELLNKKVMATRLALTTSQALPPIRVALSATLAALALEQARLSLFWNGRRVGWLARLACSRSARVVSLAPTWPYRPNPPDALGPTPWSKTRGPQVESFWLTQKKRIAGAEVYYENKQYRSRWKLPPFAPVVSLPKLVGSNAH